MNAKVNEIILIADSVGWTKEEQSKFLKARGDDKWETAKQSTIDNALSHLRDTAKMFGVTPCNRLKLYEPQQNRTTKTARLRNKKSRKASE